MRLVTATASLAGVALFNFFLRSTPLRRIFLWSNLVGTALGASQVGATWPYYLPVGLPPNTGTPGSLVSLLKSDWSHVTLLRAGAQTPSVLVGADALVRFRFILL